MATFECSAFAGTISIELSIHVSRLLPRFSNANLGFLVAGSFSSSLEESSRLRFPCLAVSFGMRVMLVVFAVQIKT